MLIVSQGTTRVPPQRWGFYQSIYPSRVGVKICNDVKSNPHPGPGWGGGVGISIDKCITSERKAGERRSTPGVSKKLGRRGEG